jgi:hypothetical protein
MPVSFGRILPTFPPAKNTGWSIDAAKSAAWSTDPAKYAGWSTDCQDRNPDTIITASTPFLKLHTTLPHMGTHVWRGTHRGI